MMILLGPMEFANLDDFLEDIGNSADNIDDDDSNAPLPPKVRRQPGRPQKHRIRTQHDAP